MSVLLQTSVGELVIDLFTEDAPYSSFNFLKLAKAKFYNNVAFHRVEKNFLAHAGAPVTADPRWNVAGLKRLEGKTGEEEDRHGCSIWGVQTLVESGAVRLALPPRAQAPPAPPVKLEGGGQPDGAATGGAPVKSEPGVEREVSSATAASPGDAAAPGASSSSEGTKAKPGAVKLEAQHTAASSLVGQTSFFSSLDFPSLAFPPFHSWHVLASAAPGPAFRPPRSARFCPDEGEGDRKIKSRRHDALGIVGWVPAEAAGSLDGGARRDAEAAGNTSVFYVTLREKIDFLDDRNLTVFGKVAEGLDILEKINLTFVDEACVPLSPIRILHAYVLDDPFADPPFLVEASATLASPLPLLEEVASDDEDLDEVLVLEKIEKKEADARKVTLEILGDLPDADAKPPENVLFVAKLNPVTQDEDLRTVFSRFGEILACDIIRDWKTGRSLQYAFITFQESSACELAYFKMQNVLIDDRRIHVDFSQSVAKEWRKYKQFGARQSTEEGQTRVPGQALPSKTVPPSGFAPPMSGFSPPAASSGFSRAPEERGGRRAGWADDEAARERQGDKQRERDRSSRYEDLRRREREDERERKWRRMRDYHERDRRSRERDRRDRERFDWDWHDRGRRGGCRTRSPYTSDSSAGEKKKKKSEKKKKTARY
ncbi:peptidyl-prolyl cis-trans isomerase, cyclophilin-type domain-containing protein [Besnoitia besnoiti]|uniref:Peptidyl-prolyl cis-trans isomerase n=1 Tax=Besnoitia besnoiti TaxID=94643 RepID=A0A2A9MH90_BESBE|nr:peptidyl-prolyl cis-trans isomerase, cyclophilin-type domain-containing protein [Besnoitia besnoiti]PFH35023.1 peptidyl-prolyl cis-trans isomerase, cyclophilin-type domain-containing protein [Besnoitia besnoiti]